MRKSVEVELDLHDTIPALTHQLEYHRLHIAINESAGIDAWSIAFDLAWGARLLDRCRQLLFGVRSTELSLRSQGIILRSRALLAMVLADNERAEIDYQRSLRLFRQVGDRYLSGRALNDLGTLHQARGDLNAAIDCYQQALALLLPEWAGSADEAMVRNNLGLACLLIGDHGLGIDALEQAGQIYRQLGLQRGEANVQVNLAQAYRRYGQMERAIEAGQNALQVVRTYGDRQVEIEVLNGLGVAYRHLGQLDQAARFYTQSLELAHQLGDLGGQAQALGNIGTIHQLQGRLDKALACYHDALLMYAAIPDLDGQARMWGNLGQIHSLDDRPEEALPCLERSLSLYRQCGDRAGEGAALLNLATANRDHIRYDAAETLYQEALTIGRTLHDARLQDLTLSALGTLRIMQQRWDEAELLLGEALRLQQARGDTYAQVETIYKLGMLANERGATGHLAEILAPGWELAQEHGYVRWLTAIAWLLGDEAFDAEEFSAFNYYALAVAVALQYDDQKRYEKGMSKLEEHIAALVDQGQVDEAEALGQYLISIWQNEDLAEWTKPAVSEIETMVCRNSHRCTP